ncbi:hypothetical protein [Chryseobacterium sp.]|uniref:hypothetical protein n=1 Tax=Chryseobacterium sp. TaxID=1871047 RepID=UPI002899A1A3|nr:hypothetical protein [Chryseobacterium sp.]
MKNILIAICTLLSTGIFAQNEVNEYLSKLFLGLDLHTTFHNTAMKSSLNFTYGVNRGINFHDEDGNSISTNTNMYDTDFTKNPLIDSVIKKGKISIIQNDQEIKSGNFSISESIWFLNPDDLMNEYYLLCSLLETLGYRVRKESVQNDNFETKREITEISLRDGDKKSTLSIGYFMPQKKQKIKEYLLSITYNNH